MNRYRAYAYVETLGVMITFVVKYMTVLTKQFVFVSCWMARTPCLSTNSVRLVSLALKRMLLTVMMLQATFLHVVELNSKLVSMVVKYH